MTHTQEQIVMSNKIESGAEFIAKLRRLWDAGVGTAREAVKAAEAKGRQAHQDVAGGTIDPASYENFIQKCDAEHRAAQHRLRQARQMAGAEIKSKHLRPWLTAKTSERDAKFAELLAIEAEIDAVLRDCRDVGTEAAF